MPQSPTINVLLIEDNPGDSRLIQESLEDVANASYCVTHVGRLGDGLRRLAEQSFDVVLLDLTLPDCQGAATLDEIHATTSTVPVVVLTGLEDEGMACKAMQQGTQDYLVKGQVSPLLLSRSIRYAIERHRMQQALRNLSLTDELTGLFNRRGFMTLSKQQLHLARRNQKKLLLIFADLDRLKLINDRLGHREGDQALRETAEILKHTFRESDIVARLGGDEFTVLVVDNSHDDLILSRLRLNLKRHNAGRARGYELSLTVGAAHVNPETTASIEDLMAQADKELYQQKKAKHLDSSGGPG
jgi:diguanylate cyclase (GGDEF)-like protein